MDPVTIAIVIALIIASELLRPKKKTEQARPPGLGDFQFPTAEEGRPVPLVWGRVRLNAPNVVWYGDLRSDPLLQKVKTGLFSSTKVLKGYEYHVGMQLALCRGNIAGVRRVWIGDQLAYDGGLATSTFDVDLPNLLGGEDGQGGVQATVSVYLGSQTSADAYLGNFQDAGFGTNRTPHYGGNAYLVVRELGHSGATVGGAYLGNSTSIQPWRVEVERYPATFSGQSAGQNKINGIDCNLANVVYEILTNTEWGWGKDVSEIDLSNFVDASDTFIAEGNGFSMVLDSTRDSEDVLREVERQGGFVVVPDPATGKYQMRLARADYDIDDVMQLSPANVLEVRNFERATWADTTNQVSVKFDKRDDQYKEAYAFAHDTANAQIQGGGTVATAAAVVTETTYPGVKDSDLAAQLAWRDLRSLSYPLARCEFVLDRQAYTAKPGDVVAWTDPQFGVVKLQMRVLKVDYGRLQDNKIVASCVQDVFYFQAASFGSPPASGWAVPSITLAAYSNSPAYQKAMEAPRAIVERDPSFAGDISLSRVLAFVRRQGAESSFLIKQRHSSGTPAGSYTDAGEVVGFVLVGKLDSSLAVGTAVPTTTITVKADPDAKADLLAAFPGTATLENLGQDLAQLILVGNEFMLVSSAAANGTKVDLQNVYRGVLDSVQQTHSADDLVYLVFLGAGLADVPFQYTDNVDLELRAKSPQDTFAGSVTAISLAMNKRTVRPYPVAAPLFDGSTTSYGTPNLEASGSGLNGLRTQTSWIRRDFRVGDEIHALLCDGTTVSASTEHQLEVRADPTGANTLVGSVSSWATGTGPVNVTLADVVTAAAIGTPLRFTVRTRHDIGIDTDLQSLYDMTYDVTPSSATYSGKFYLGGGITAGSNSNSYTAVATGTFTLEIGALQATAAIQVSINGGAYSTVIAAGNTSGTFSATSGDTIRVKRTVSEAPNPNFVRLKNPSAAVVAYGTFKT